MSLKIFRSLENNNFAKTGTVLTIGNFDGIHKGHQHILKLMEEEKIKFKAPTTLITFEPYPKEFFSPETAPARLTNFHEKAHLLKSSNLDYLLCLKFSTKLSQISAQSFIENILINQLAVKSLIVGEDFRFGYRRQGDFDLLQEAAAKYQFNLIACPTITENNHRISSTQIREALHKSDFMAAQQMLARPFYFTGKVIHGDARGRTWGFPTANLLLKRVRLPLKGIFAVEIQIGNNHKNLFKGVASIGIRPMFQEPRGLLEVYLFDFNEELYQKEIRVFIRAKLREELVFKSELELRRQIELDVAQAKSFFQTVEI